MPILADLSRRFHLLTTDAKPDPPRVAIPDHTNNLQPPTDKESKEKTRSLPTTPVKEHSNETIRRQKSLQNNATDVDEDFERKERDEKTSSPTNSKENQKKFGARTKTKNKYTQGGNVINYNIINSSGVKIGARTNYICNVDQYSASSSSQPEGTWSKPRSMPMPEDVESLTSCEDEITSDDLFVAKTHMGHGWRDVARRLSYSDGQIEQFEENHRHKGIDEVIYQLLLDWKQANAKNAQVGTLICTLWYCHEYDCAERLAGARKNAS